MTSIHTHTTLDGAALRRAFSDRNGAALTALYADHATIEVADAQNTPSAPLKLEVRDAIRAYFEDIFARDMTHKVDRVAITGDSAGFSVRCVYPDGLRVLCVATAEVSDGLIVRSSPPKPGTDRLAGEVEAVVEPPRNRHDFRPALTQTT